MIIIVEFVEQNVVIFIFSYNIKSKYACILYYVALLWKLFSFLPSELDKVIWTEVHSVQFAFMS